MQVFKKKDENVAILCSLEMWENLFFVPLVAREWFGKQCYVIGTNTATNNSPFIFLCDEELESDDIRIIAYQLRHHPEKFDAFKIMPNDKTLGFDIEEERKTA